MEQLNISDLNYFTALRLCCRRLESDEREPEGSKFKGMNKYETRKPTVGFSTKHSSLKYTFWCL